MKLRRSLESMSSARWTVVCVLGAVFSVMAVGLSGCGTEDVPPGSKGFMFDRTGLFALYTGGDGLEDDEILEPGTHFTGLYDEVRMVDCRDESAKEVVETLTRSDLTVTVDLRITFSADCSGKESLIKILDQVAATDGTVEPEALYDRYILPVVRASLRNRLADVTIEDVKAVRGELTAGILEDLRSELTAAGHPVLVKVFHVSNIVLPPEITEKNKMIELARQEAEQEREKQAAATVRLERELFEAQQERKVQVEQAQKAAEIAAIDAERDKVVRIQRAEADKQASLLDAEAAKQAVILRSEGELERAKREALGIAELRKELTPQYMTYLELLKNTEVQNNMAGALGAGTVFYVDKDFVVPPGANRSIAVSP